jgi:hypothetical protein
MFFDLRLAEGCSAFAARNVYFSDEYALSVIPVDSMTDEEFERYAFKILQRELGIDGLARFLRLNRAGSKDYTRDRYRWLRQTTIQEIMSELAIRRDPKA